MADALKGLFGGGTDAAQAQMQAQQRTTLAQFAQQQGTIDQAGATGAKRTGNRLLAFLSGDGQSTFG